MEGKSGDPFELFWALALAAAAAAAVWWLWSAELVHWVFHLKLAELKAAVALGSGDATAAELAAALRGALTAPDRISFDAFAFAMEAVGQYWRAPAAAALAALAAALLLWHPAARFRRRFDLRGLAEAMADSWPYALHALRRGNLTLALDHPVWGMGLSAVRFAARHALLEPDAASGWSLREDRAVEVFADQLGEPWTGRPPPAALALAGLLALQVTAARASDAALAARLERRAQWHWERLSLEAAAHEDGDYLPPPAAYEAAIRDAESALEAEAVRALVAGHAYTSTVLLRLLDEAREGGVLPSAWFTWLKGVDRPLWYALCSLGRRAVFVEGLGALAHYRAERRAGAPLAAPALRAAVEGLRDDLHRAPAATLVALASE